MNTFEEIKGFDLQTIEARVVEIRSLMNDENADIEALIAETDALIARKNEIEESKTKFAELRSKIAASDSVIEENKSIIKGEKTMDLKEVRNSKRYIDAYAEYIKTNDDKECRKILTELADYSYGSNNRVPVPVIVEPVIKTAWESRKLLDMVTKTELKGIVKIGVETSAGDAGIHEEGDSAISEESLELTIVSLTPQTIKKWVSFSDEVNDMNGAAFVEYIYSEIANKIFAKVEDMIVNAIMYDAHGLVKQLSATFTAVDFIKAVSVLSDTATKPVIVMNKLSYPYYKQIAMNANYGIDVFDGMDVVFNNKLDVVTDSEATGNIGIVGDMSAVTVNFPAGQNIEFKYDDLTLASADLVKVIGRLPVAVSVTRKNHFAVLTA